MDQKLIERINELARLAKERVLTPEEAEERAELRAAYLTEFRGQMRTTLDNTYVEYPDGTRKHITEHNKDNQSS